MKEFLRARWPWGLALGLLYWALRDIPWTSMVQLLLQIPPWALVGLFLLNWLIIVLLALRWWWILRWAQIDIAFPRLLIYRLAAFGFNYFTPGPQIGGEPLKVFWLMRRHHASLEQALISVVLDKGYELVSSFTVLILGLMVSAMVLGNASPTLFAGLALPAALGLGYPALLSRGIRPLARFETQRAVEPDAGHAAVPCSLGCRIRRGLAIIARIEAAMARFYRERRGLAWGLYGLSGFIWLLMLWEYYWTWQLLGVSLTWPEAITALTAARLAILSPLPGDTGVLEAGQRWAAVALGIPPIQGVAMALIIRVRDVLFAGTGLLWGLRFLVARPVIPSRET